MRSGGIGCDLGEIGCDLAEIGFIAGKNSQSSRNRIKKPYLKQARNKKVMAKTKPAKKFEHPVFCLVF